jgi:hypothetical protein
MNAEEKSRFKLDDGFGAESPSVCERMVRKVWGKDHWVEVYNALCDNPVVALPIVLARLKQKDEDWKRAEREWNKVWREVVRALLSVPTFAVLTATPIAGLEEFLSCSRSPRSELQSDRQEDLHDIQIAHDRN